MDNKISEMICIVLGKCDVSSRRLALLGLFLAHLALSSHPAGTSRRTLSGCVRGDGCSKCPDIRYTKIEDGSRLCCPSCAPAALYYGDFPNDWCVCYMGGEKKEVIPRSIKFPDQSGQEPASSPTFSSREDAGKLIVSAGPTLRDTQFILNTGDRVGSFPSTRVATGIRVATGTSTRVATRRPTSRPTSTRVATGVSQGVQQALTLLADTVESLHARVSRLEEFIITNQDQRVPVSESIDRVGVVTPASTLPLTPTSCLTTNFTRVGRHCYYSSVTHDHRAVWKDARTACSAMGAKLAEPLTRGEFIDLTQHLSLMPSSTGFSYWSGGLYPGVSWLWAYAGQKVPLSPMYWTGEDALGNRVTPGDTSLGRCLAFSYLVRAASYFYGAEECGYEKYYICELLEQTS